MCWIRAVALDDTDVKQSGESDNLLSSEADKEIPGWISLEPVEGTAVLGLYPVEGLSALVGISGGDN
jgi:hypothetical protein